MAKTKPQPDEQLKAKRELFCRYYTQNGELFGNATLSYAEAFDYKLDELSSDAIYKDELDTDTGEKVRRLVEDSPYDRAYHVCSVQSSKLLRNTDIQDRITVLLNELLKDEVVDSQLAKLIKQDRDNTAKVAAIREYNKLRGRIIDKSDITTHEEFTENDIRAILSVLPQERQDEVYAIITSAIAEAELLRSSAKIQGSSAQ